MWMLFVKKRGPLGIMACVNRIPLWNCLDLYQQIGEFHKPTLLLWGKCDKVIPIKVSYDFQKALKNSLLVKFDDCGHLLLSDKPMETICTCIAFLNIQYTKSSQINVTKFRNWLPFDENGHYIHKLSRSIDYSVDEDTDELNLPSNQILVTIDEYENDIKFPDM